MDEIQLTRAISRGDQKAFKSFFERHYAPLSAYVATLSGEHFVAEDIAQQSFLTVWKNRKKLRDQPPLKNYLYTIAYHLFVDHYHHTQRELRMIERLKKEALEVRIHEVDEASASRLAKLQTIIDALPERCREILTLSKMQNMKYREIAEQLGISVKTVESQMRIAYQRIREGIGEE